MGDRPFRFDHAPSSAAAYLGQRTLFERLDRGQVVDSLELEESVLALLAVVLEDAYAARGRTCPRPDDRDEQDIARDARLALGAHFTEDLSLADLARLLRTSRARLCRAFRRVTGTTLHAYREQLRLRAALEALVASRGHLTGLALDLGYSSHSHFSASFKRAFGLSPAEAGGCLSAGAARPAPPRRRTRGPS